MTEAVVVIIVMAMTIARASGPICPVELLCDRAGVRLTPGLLVLLRTCPRERLPRAVARIAELAGVSASRTACVRWIAAGYRDVRIVDVTTRLAPDASCVGQDPERMGSVVEIRTSRTKGGWSSRRTERHVPVYVWAEQVEMLDRRTAELALLLSIETM